MEKTSVIKQLLKTRLRTNNIIASKIRADFKKLFLKFLLQHDEYHTYVEGITTTDWEYRMTPQNFLYDAFDWESTKHNHNDWEDLNGRWITLYKGKINGL